MARQLTKKQRGFVKDYIETSNGTLAVKQNYTVANDNVAAVLASKMVSLGKIQEAFDDAGFNEDNAKKVVGQILLDKRVKPDSRLKAAQEVFKVKGSYAPEKRQALNVNLSGQILPNNELEAVRTEFEEKLKTKLLNENAQ